MPWLLRCWKALGRWPRLQQWLLRRLYPHFLVGVVGVLFDPAGKVVLFHHPYRRRFPWGLPGGWLQRGEEPAAALAREIKEETNLEVEILAPLAATAVNVAPNFEVIYLARLAGGQFQPSAEVDEIGFFTAENLPEMKTYQREAVLAAFAAAAAQRLPGRVWPGK